MDEERRTKESAIKASVSGSGLAYEEAADIREGKAAVRQMWFALNHAAVVVADLTGGDAGVMYGLGIAHTLGKETILIYPQGSKYLTDIPRTHRIEYDDSEAGRSRMEEELAEMLGAMLAPVVED